MRYRIKKIVKTWRSDYQYSTTISSTLSVLINIAFTIFNGILGIVYLSLWNGTICIYYMLLSVIRAILVETQRKKTMQKQSFDENHLRKVYIDTHLMLLLMDISLIVPIVVMVRGERIYTYGLIPAIAMAAFTTYRITMAIVHFRKSRKHDNLLISELRMINLTDALLAVLTLQNALINANGGMNVKMTVLSAWSSGCIFATIIFITIRSILKVKRDR